MAHTTTTSSGKWRPFIMGHCNLVLLLLVSLYFSNTITPLVAALEDYSELDKTGFSVDVYEGPTHQGGTCTPENKIEAGNYAEIHFTVSIADGSKTGEVGKVYETTRSHNDGSEEDHPIGVTLGTGEVIPGWDLGLLGLCVGDKARLIVPPPLAYGETGTGHGPNDIPGDATILFDVEIVSVQDENPHPHDEEEEEDALHMFEQADTNRDGQLSRTEFDALFMRQLQEEGLDSTEIDAMKAQLQHFWDLQDVDGNGFLSLEEFLQQDDLDEEEHATPEEEFAALDDNGDGKLSKQEIDDFFESLGQQVPEDFWEHMDENKDGFIQFDEFFVEGDYDDYEDHLYGDEDYDGDEEDIADEL